MSARSYVLTTADSDEWEQLIEVCTTYDVYHLPRYHKLVEEDNEASAALFVFEQGDTVIAMPLLIRRISVDDDFVSDYRDITSVYGYPGPVSNVTDHTEDVIRVFSNHFRDYLIQENIVTAFSRLHPLIDQVAILSALGEVVEIGPTVAVDLTLTDDVLVDQYRDGHAYDIDKATREGVEGVHDKAWDYYDDFIAMYYDTMRRVNADSHYFFDRSYFSRMRELLGDHLHLFVAVKDGTAISGSLFFHCGSIIQYHLSGTASDHLSLAPSKLLLDRVRRWGNEIGAQTLHLGGGVGGREDGVFRFKSGFSDQTHRFSVWRYIVDQDVYRELVDQKRQWNEARVLEVVDKDFFPAYRAPVVAKDDEQ